MIRLHHIPKGFHFASHDAIVGHLGVLRLDRLFLEQWKKLSPEARLLLWVQTIFGVGQSMGALFLAIFLWKQSHTFKEIASFSLANFPAIFIGFVIVGILAKHLQLRRSLQIGIALYVLTYVLLIALRENAGQVAWLMGALMGLGGGFLWASRNSIEYRSTTDGNRDSYYGILTALDYVIAIVGPAGAGVILGTAPTTLNYSGLFAAVIAVLSISAVLAGRFSKTYLPESRINFLAPFASSIWRWLGAREFLGAFMGGASGFLGAILIFSILRGELDLGIYSSIFAFASAIVSLAVGGMLAKLHRIRTAFVGATLLAVSRTIFIKLFSFSGLVVSTLIEVFASPLFNVGMAATFYGAIDHADHGRDHFYQIFLGREFVIALGRTAGVVAFLMFLGKADAMESAKTWFLFLGFIPLAYLALTKRIIVEQTKTPTLQTFAAQKLNGQA